MKLWSKEALVLGGIYGVLETPLSLLDFERTTEIIFLLFVGCGLMLCFNRTPKFLSALISGYPKTAYYLSAIGWIPYFLLIITIAFMGSSYYISYPQKFTTSFLYGLAYTGLGMAFISFVIAFFRTKIKT